MLIFGQVGDADIFALNETFPDILNIYYSDSATPHLHKPAYVARDGQNQSVVRTKNCP